MEEHDWQRLPHDYAGLGSFSEFFECTKCKRRKTGKLVKWSKARGAVAGYYHVAAPDGCLGREGATPAEEKIHAETAALVARLQAEREELEVKIRASGAYAKNREAIEVARAAYLMADAEGFDPEKVYDLALDDAEREAKEKKPEKEETK